MDEARGRHPRLSFSAISDHGRESRPIAEVDEDALDAETEDSVTEASSSAFSGRPGAGGRGGHHHVPALSPLTPRARSPQALAALQPPGEATPLLKHEEAAVEEVGRRTEAAVLVSYALPILGT